MNFDIRDLYEKILNYDGDNIYQELLKPWIEDTQYKNFIASLSDFKNLTNEENWELYALNRVLDILTLRFTPNKNADKSIWDGPKISIDEFLFFVKEIGLDYFYPKTYTTFNCEIIEASSGENDFEIIDYAFPTIKLNNLLIKRSGVHLSLKSEVHDLNLINNSTIYWTFRRKNRNYLDLSHGWGSNSQWRTEFRIDLETENTFIYNLNGEFDLNEMSKQTLNELKEQKLEWYEALELILNRHFVECTKEDNDLYPYDFKYEEKKNYR